MHSTIRLAMLLAAGSLAAACARPNPLREPRPAHVAAPAPDSFLVDVTTSRGTFAIKVRRPWAPAGVDRFHYLVANGFYDGSRFFRVVRNFVVQFGLSGDPAVSAAWYQRFLPDDSVRTTNRRGTVSFARSGPETRTTQLFINLRDNARLDTLNGFGFPPIGEVVQGMAVVDSLNGEYGEVAPRGRGPAQDSIRLQGSAYMARAFPRLDSIVSARITQTWGAR